VGQRRQHLQPRQLRRALDVARRGAIRLAGLCLAALSLGAFAGGTPEPEPPAPLIASVGYPVDAGPRELVEGLIGVRRGQRLSRQAVQRSIQRLYATGR